MSRTSTPKTLADLGEKAFLTQVSRWFRADQKTLELGIGDDAALLGRAAAGAGSLAVTTDTLVEGVHFRHDWAGTPADLGHKALAVNLSDLAAMAARPVAAFLALSVPPSTPLADLRGFFMGLRAEGRRWGCPLAGGDLTRAPQWVIGLTVMGRVEGCRPAPRRAAARPGQTLYVTGWPGLSGAGLDLLGRGKPELAPTLVRRHRRPTPRLDVARALQRACPDLAMLDVSDGIWNDAGQMATAASVGIDLLAPALPVAPALKTLAARLQADPLRWILFGGEDYELLLATSRPLPALRRALDRAGLSVPLHPIGQITAPRRGPAAVRLLDAAGRPVKIEDMTFKHF